MRLRSVLILALATATLHAESHEFELGVENYLYQTEASPLNLGNVLGLSPYEDIFRGTLHAKEIWGGARFVLSGYLETRPGHSDTTQWTTREAYAQYGFGPGVSFRFGKQRIEWGSGLAWNPTNRLEPPKSAVNTALEQEGVLAARMDWIPASWVGVILLAARGDTRPRDLPFTVSEGTVSTGAMRARFLVKNTDIALSLSGGTNQHRLVGLDVARNVGGFAVHAEGALYRGSEIPPSRPDSTFMRLAAGILEIRGTGSYSLEYFLNGEGYSGSSFQAYLDSLRGSFARASDPLLPAPVRQAALTTYLSEAVIPFTRGLGLRRHYLHAGWTRGEIRGKWGLSAQSVVNLSDGGLALTPGVSLAARDDLTLNLDAVLLFGGKEAEYRLVPIRGALQGRLRFLF